VVGLALLLASLGMLGYVERSLTAQVGDEVALRARELARDPAAIADGTTVQVPDEHEEFVQVLADGGVIASSASAAGEAAVAASPAGQDATVASVPFARGPFVVAAVDAITPAGHRTIVVGRNIDDVLEARRTVARGLFLGMPVLLLVVAAVTWWIVGRALHPVEDMRAEAERISTREMHRRLPGSRGNDELARLAATMNGMLDRLEQGRDRQRRFVSDASHELRSPVASIRQHAEVAMAHPEGTAAGDLAEVVLQEDARLQRLVEDLLLLAHLDEQEGSAPAEEVDIDDLVMEEAARVRSATRLDVDTRGISAGRVRGNRLNLERVVRNLTSNAVRHARKRAAFGVSERDGHVLLSVEDDGPGIPVEDRERVFDRFVRLDGARDRGSGGSGLGLSIVRDVVASHGGEVAMGESSLGGLRVEVRLPSPSADGARPTGEVSGDSRA
jgi:signal transduction histidine kinase